MSLVIRECTGAELLADSTLPALLDEYAIESSIKGLPHPRAKIDTYLALESVGAIKMFGAFFDESLIGFITVLPSVLPHYSEKVAVSESFFVAEKHRSSGAGLKLLRVAEEYARSSESCGMLVCAPMGGALVEVLPRVGYDETNRVFFKSMSDSAVDKVTQIESMAAQMPQVFIKTDHTLHAGMYARTVMVPAGCMITGALIKIPTILVISGDVIAYIGEETVELSGYNVIQAYAHRKQAFVAVTDTFLTMVFPTSATDIESAESEFTDETEKLITRKESESL